MSRTVTLDEHQACTVAAADPEERQFTVAEIEALDRVQKRQDVDAFRFTGRNRIKANQNVGLLAAGGVRLEVLPKIAGLGRDRTRGVLVRMIARSWGIPLSAGEITGHDVQHDDLLEVLLELFARRLLVEIRRGLSRSYSAEADDLGRLRGRLDVVRQFTRLAATPGKVACRFDEFTADTPLNRLLLCAAVHLGRLARAGGTQRLLAEVAAHFAGVALVAPTEALQAEVVADRRQARWEIPERLARLLLSARYQTLHGGNSEGVALLFDMNRLFELFVADLARKALGPLGYAVSVQSPQRCLARGRDGLRSFLTRPDIHVEGRGTTSILDTKWKRLDPLRQFADVAQSDAYQMHGYAQVYAADSAVLLYPHHDLFAEPQGIQAEWCFARSGRALRLATIDVADEAGAMECLRAACEPLPGPGETEPRSRLGQPASGRP